MKISAVLAGIMIICAAISPAYGEEEQWAEAKHQQMKAIMDEIAVELELTEEQKAKIGEERNKVWNKKKTMRAELNEKKETLKEELRKTEINQGEVDRLVKEITELQGLKLKTHVDSLLAVRSILTTGQFREFQEKLDQRKKAWKKQQGVSSGDHE